MSFCFDRYYNTKMRIKEMLGHDSDTSSISDYLDDIPPAEYHETKAFIEDKCSTLNISSVLKCMEPMSLIQHSTRSKTIHYLYDTSSAGMLRSTVHYTDRHYKWLLSMYMHVLTSALRTNQSVLVTCEWMANLYTLVDESNYSDPISDSIYTISNNTCDIPDITQTSASDYLLDMLRKTGVSYRYIERVLKNVNYNKNQVVMHILCRLYNEVPYEIVPRRISDIYPEDDVFIINPIVPQQVHTLKCIMCGKKSDGSINTVVVMNNVFERVSLCGFRCFEALDIA